VKNPIAFFKGKKVKKAAGSPLKMGLAFKENGGL
jgi:hypothetical protein